MRMPAVDRRFSAEPPIPAQLAQQEDEKEKHRHGQKPQRADPVFCPWHQRIAGGALEEQGTGREAFQLREPRGSMRGRLINQSNKQCPVILGLKAVLGLFYCQPKVFPFQLDDFAHFIEA